MKHIKKINEKFEVDFIKELSDNYLAYLLDDGFETEVYSQNIDTIIITISNYNRIEDILTPEWLEFKWNDVKDYILPFLQILDNDYNIDDINFNKFKRKESDGRFRKSFTLSKLLEDKLDDFSTNKIYIKLTNKKSFIKKINQFFLNKKKSIRNKSFDQWVNGDDWNEITQ
jgi:hypothetical protein